MSRKVHAEGVRERQNMRNNNTAHQLEPKSVDGSGRMHWCCPNHMQQSKEEGVLDEWLDKNGYEFDEDEGRYVET